MEKASELQGNVGTLMLGHYLHGMVLFVMGEFVEARALLEQCHGLDESIHRENCRTLIAEDPHAGALATLALTLTYLGYVDNGRVQMERALSAARRLTHAYTVVTVLVWKCWANWAPGCLMRLKVPPRRS